MTNTDPGAGSTDTATTHTTTSRTRTSGTRTSDTVWWRDTWVLDADRTKRLTAAFVAVTAVGITIGLLVYRIEPSNPITRFDERVADWFVDQRTAGRDPLANWGALLADTPVKIGISAAFAAFALWRWRRWREPLLVVVSLVFEATAFIIITFVVGRDRPDVERLLDSPVNTSFPSGHVAAATVYGAFVVILFWHVRSTIARAAGIVGCSFVVVAVGFGRLYQGMHYLTDVIAGIVLGVITLIICVHVIGVPDDEALDRERPRVRTKRLETARNADSREIAVSRASNRRRDPGDR